MRLPLPVTVQVGRFYDGGVDALVLRLAGELADVRIEGTTVIAGGGATNAVCLHRVRDAGLGGMEFAAAIPGKRGLARSFFNRSSIGIPPGKGMIQVG